MDSSPFTWGKDTAETAPRLLISQFVDFIFSYKKKSKKNPTNPPVIIRAAIFWQNSSPELFIDLLNISCSLIVGRTAKSMCQSAGGLLESPHQGHNPTPPVFGPEAGKHHTASNNKHQ